MSAQARSREAENLFNLVVDQDVRETIRVHEQYKNGLVVSANRFFCPDYGLDCCHWPCHRD